MLITSRTAIPIAAAATLVTAALALPPRRDESAAAQTPPAVLQLLSRETSETAVDVGRHGHSPGDFELATDRLYRADGTGNAIGGDQATIVSVTADLADVRGTFTVPGGTLVVGGSVRFGKPILIAVLGGTGTYADARGTLTITQRGAHAAALAFHLS
jgi:hypothetical protein